MTLDPNLESRKVESENYIHNHKYMKYNYRVYQTQKQSSELMDKEQHRQKWTETKLLAIVMKQKGKISEENQKKTDQVAIRLKYSNEREN